MDDFVVDWEQILIHIGHPRCGSTFLQQVFFPQLPVDIMNRWGEDQSKLNMEIYDLVRSKEYCSELFLNWIKSKIDKNYTKLVISQETLGWDENAYDTCKNLHETFPNAKILIIIRNQFDFIISNYCFKVTTGAFHESRNFIEYIEYLDGIGYFKMLEYDRLISYYMDLFGKNNVQILPLEMLYKDPFSFYHKIMKYISIDKKIPLDLNKALVNQSFKNQKVIAKMIKLNKLFAKFYDQFKAINPSIYWDNKVRFCYYHLKTPLVSIIAYLYHKDDKSVEISDFWKNKLKIQFGQSNERLNKLIDIDLIDYDYIFEQ